MRIAERGGREVHVLPYTEGSSFVMWKHASNELAVRVDRDEAIRMAGILVAHALGLSERADVEQTVGYIESIARGLSR